jgi:geranylgeranyl diphosphate synthase type I
MTQYPDFCSEFRAHLITWWDSQSIPTDLQFIFKPVRALLLKGKFLRPYVYASGAGDSYQVSTALALELLHLFALVHDDIIDQSPLRRGTPTVHTVLTKDFAQTATDQTIIIGDWILARSFACLQNASAPITQVYHQLLEEVTYGQLYDIQFTEAAFVTRQQVKQKNILKTAHYSFTRPLMMGYLEHCTKKVSKDDTDWILRFGTAIGLYFQTQDDALDLADKTGKPRFNDIYEGQWTLIRHLIWERATDAQKTWFDSLKTQSVGDCDATIQKILLQYDIVALMDQEIQTLADEVELILEASPNETLRSVGQNLFTLLQNRKK